MFSQHCVQWLYACTEDEQLLVIRITKYLYYSMHSEQMNSNFGLAVTMQPVLYRIYVKCIWIKIISVCVHMGEIRQEISKHLYTHYSRHPEGVYTPYMSLQLSAALIRYMPMGGDQGVVIIIFLFTTPHTMKSIIS